MAVTNDSLAKHQWDYVGLRNSLFTRPELSSVSHSLFTLDQDFYVGATQNYGLLSIIFIMNIFW